MKILPRNRRARVFAIVGALIVFLGVGYLLAWHVARPFYKSWREKRANEVAREYLQKGDYPNAILAVRKTLQYNKTNIEAWKLAVEITEKQGVQDVVFYQLQLANVQPTFENRLKALQVAVKYNDFRDADSIISKVGEEGSKSAEFLELASTVSRRMGNATRAKYYLMSLVSLQPSNNKARFDLAQLRLMEGVAENKPSIRADIRNLASDPEIRPRALALLLTDSLQAQNSTEALELADQLAALPDTPPPSRVLVIDAYRRYAPTRFKTYLAQTEQDFASDAMKVIILTNYLISNEMAADTRAWIDSLDEKVKSNEGVQVSYAYALMMTKDLDGMEAYLRNCKWQENEFARYALLAYRYRLAGRDREFADTWKLAVIEVGNNPRRLQTLTAQVTAWGWQDQKFELLWKRFMLEPSNQSLRNQLVAWEQSHGNTAGLNRLFARITEIDPNDLDSKNNYAYTSILLGINTERANQAALEVYRAKPNNHYYATTEALALYRQRKYAEALEIMQNMGVQAMTQPARAMLHAAILIANGRYDEGSNMMMGLNPSTLLPEERALFNEAMGGIDRARREQGLKDRLAVLSSAGTQGADRKSWLRALPGSLRESPTVQMELADSLYGNDDYKGLENALKGDKWNERDFLRLALLAYAQRQQNALNDSSATWRAAVGLAGNRGPNLSALTDLAHRWGWTAEYIEVLNRSYQRDPSDDKAFGELSDYYTKNNQTGDLARIYQQRVDGNPNDADAKSRLAYYSMLTNTNAARAFTLAREAYDAAPENPFRAKVYAFAFYKQSRGNDGWPLVEKLAAKKESGQLQTSLVKAALAAQQNRAKEARAFLSDFDASSALPEEVALADSLSKSLAQDS